jgi:hypothetical protein
MRSHRGKVSIEVPFMGTHANALIECHPPKIRSGFTKALVFNGEDEIELQERPIPKPGQGEAVIEVMEFISRAIQEVPAEAR